MVDVVDKATRSRMMSGIRGKNTKPELAVRSALHRRGFRFRLHSTAVPGRPDLTFAKHRAVVLVHGCFWHGHDCRFFKLPGTRQPFWQSKIRTNQLRDARVLSELLDSGWRVLLIWECALRTKSSAEISREMDRAAKWLLGHSQFLEIRGKDD